MVSKYYLQGKIESVDACVGYIAGKANPKDCADLHFLTKTVKGAIDNAAHRLDDMHEFPECRVMIFRLVMHLKNKFTEINKYAEPESLNDIRWCFENIGCIFIELNVSDEELAAHDWCFDEEENARTRTLLNLNPPEESEIPIEVENEPNRDCDVEEREAVNEADADTHYSEAIPEDTELSVEEKIGDAAHVDVETLI